MCFVKLLRTHFVHSTMFRTQQLYEGSQVESVERSSLGVQCAMCPISPGAARGNIAEAAGSISSLLQQKADKAHALLKTLREMKPAEGVHYNTGGPVGKQCSGHQASSRPRQRWSRAGKPSLGVRQRRASECSWSNIRGRMWPSERHRKSESTSRAMRRYHLGKKRSQRSKRRNLRPQRAAAMNRQRQHKR